MKIELTIRRNGGSRVTLWGQTFHFKPDDRGRHVCDIADPQVAQHFLKLDAAYRMVDGESAGGNAPQAGAGADGEATAPAPDMPEPDWDQIDVTALARPELVELYTSLSGTKPHPKSKVETLRANVTALIEAKLTAAGE